MKLEHLNENADLATVIQQIRRDCSDFLRSTNQPLYRGVKGGGKIGLSRIRTDRVPMTASEEETNVFNVALEARAVAPPRIRNSSAFCSTNRLTSMFYGELYVAFPKNSAIVAFNPYVGDSLAITGDIIAKNFNAYPCINEPFYMDDVKYWREYKQKYEHYIGEFQQYTTQYFSDYEVGYVTQLKRLPSGNEPKVEVMVYDDSIYLIPVSAIPGGFGYYEEWLNSTVRG